MSIHIAKLLVKEDILSVDQVGEVLRKQEESGCTFITTLLNLNYIDEITLMVLISQEYSIPYLNNDEINCEDKIIELIPLKIALENQIIPFMKTDTDLFVAVSDPSDLYLQDYLNFITGNNIKFLLTSERTILKAIDKYYKKNEAKIESINSNNTNQTNSNLTNSEFSIENVVSELTQYKKSLDSKKEPKETEEIIEEKVELEVADISNEIEKEQISQEELENVDYLAGFRSAVSASSAGISTSSSIPSTDIYKPFITTKNYENNNYNILDEGEEEIETDFTPDIFSDDSENNIFEEDAQSTESEVEEQISFEQSNEYSEESSELDFNKTDLFEEEKDEIIAKNETNTENLKDKEEITELLSELPPTVEALDEAVSSQLVLVVDDSPTILRLVTMILEKSGYEVITALSGLEALAKAKEKKPNLMLLDINLPHLDGYQICKIIKGNKQTAGIPIVMLSGRDGFFDKIKGKMVGAKHYITKPFDSTTLISATERFIKKDID